MRQKITVGVRRGVAPLVVATFVLESSVLAMDSKGAAQAGDVTGALFFAVVLFLIAVLGYFLPSIIALMRSKASAISIVVLNLFLGWTLIGWLVALIWAVAADPQPQQVIVQVPATPPSAKKSAALCSTCGKYSEPGTKFCPHCGAPFSA